MKFVLLVFAAALGLVFLSAPAQGETISYVDLVQRLTDLERLAVLPEKGEQCAQWSSYDRSSRYDEETNTYVAWSGNKDGFDVIRREDDGAAVVAEMDGPGCIWRIWSARPTLGHVKIFIDGKETPVVDLPFDGYFNLENAPFMYPSLCYNAAKGLNCYIPIPYQESCKIVAEEGWGAYYHFTYGTFPKGTKVPSFTRDLPGDALEALAKADRFLSEGLGSDPAGKRKKEETISESIDVNPGERIQVAELKGKGAITALKVKVSAALSKEQAAAALRETVLQIKWDGEEEPSVWAPLGDFFGTVPGLNQYKSLTAGLQGGEFYSYWYMPFKKGAVIELLNEGDVEYSVDFSITRAPLTRKIKTLGRFHAKWHRDAFLPEDPNRAIDWTMLQTKGRGRFCGVMLHVWNPKGGWWGEGDEKFFVDGEEFPSTFGTGSEDYFGYAWCNQQLFQRPFHNQTYNEIRNIGHISVNRWQVADNVPFQSSFEGAMEKYYPNERPALYACTSFWYLDPKGEDPYGPVDVEERTGYYDYLSPSFPRDKLLYDYTLMDVGRTTGGFADWTRVRHPDTLELWMYMRWDGAKPGDELFLNIGSFQDEGEYEISIKFTKRRGLGSGQFYLDGKKLGEPVSAHADGLERTEEISFGRHYLASGEHELKVRLTDGQEFAFETVRFTPVESSAGE